MTNQVKDAINAESVKSYEFDDSNIVGFATLASNEVEGPVVSAVTLPINIRKIDLVPIVNNFNKI